MSDNGNNIPEEAKLTSAYNFVPLGRYIYYPEWEKYANYDYPLKDGIDGTIDIQITNVSPLFIRNGSKERDASEIFSCYINEEGGIRYFLPGSSLRGLLRSTVELLSFSQMEQFSDTIISYRDFVNDEEGDTDYKKEGQKSRAGWLQLNEGEWKLYPCEGPYKRISIKEINEFCGDGDINEKGEDERPIRELSWNRNKYFEEKGKGMYPLYKKEEEEYHIVCTGIKRVSKKKTSEKNEKFRYKISEYLFPVKVGKVINLSKENIEDIFKLHAQERNFGEYKKMLYRGERVAVFFLVEEEGYYNIGMSRFNKFRRKHTPKELVKKHIVNLDATRYDLASLLFGFGGSNSKKRRLRGKVQVGHALCTKIESLPSGEKPFQYKLARPRPTYNPLYLMQSADQKRYKTYDDDDAVLAGRKQYRIHKCDQPNPSSDRESDKESNNAFIPITPGHIFKYRINLHNMCPIEIGALLTAITLFNDKKAYHNIGLAKSFGYGKIKTEVTSIRLTDKIKKYAGGFNTIEIVKYFIKEFEKAMSLFTYSHGDLYDPNENNPLMWAETPTVKKFLGIKHYHSDETVRQMPKDTYRLVRKNDNFQTLTEPDVSGLSLLSDEDKDIIRQTTQEH